MSEQENEGLIGDLGNLWDAGVSAAGHAASAAGHMADFVVDDLQAGAQGVLGVADYALGDPEGGAHHFDAALQNGSEMIDDLQQAGEDIY